MRTISFEDQISGQICESGSSPQENKCRQKALKPNHCPRRECIFAFPSSFVFSPFRVFVIRILKDRKKSRSRKHEILKTRKYGKIEAALENFGFRNLPPCDLRITPSALMISLSGLRSASPVKFSDRNPQGLVYESLSKHKISSNLPIDGLPELSDDRLIGAFVSCRFGRRLVANETDRTTRIRLLSRSTGRFEN